MKTEHFEYVKSKKIDPKPSMTKLCHKRNITTMMVLYPEMYSDLYSSNKTSQQYKDHIKFVTGSADGKVKIWTYNRPDCEQTIDVSEYMVLAVTFMELSKRLVVASADRKISFYELTNGQKFSPNTVSKIENLLAIPLCLEYYRWTSTSYIDDEMVGEESKGKDDKGGQQRKLETLLMGDDLGVLHKYDFTMENWHWCHFDGKKFKKDPITGQMIVNYCCNVEIDDKYQRKLDQAFKDEKEAAKARNKQHREKLNA